MLSCASAPLIASSLILEPKFLKMFHSELRSNINKNLNLIKNINVHSVINHHTPGDFFGLISRYLSECFSSLSEQFLQELDELSVVLGGEL